MRYIVILLGFVFFSCGTHKINSPVFKCPPIGVCSYEKHENKSLIIKRDDIGALYYQTEDYSGKTVFVYRYEQNVDKSYIDGHYIEEIIFEINNEVLKGDFKDLKPDKILFGVFCYCKGKAGHYVVENSSVSYQKKTNTIIISINQILENQILNTVEIPFNK